MSRVYAIILSWGAVILALDQWTKELALRALGHEGDSIPFLGWWNFTLVHNHGAAFGMFRDLPETIRQAFFILMPLSILTLLWWLYVKRFKPTENLGPLSMGLVLGGAIGNLVDRLHFGYVIDFVDWFYPSSGSCLPQFHHFTPATCHWPVFNVADSAIFVAMVLLVAQSFRRPEPDAAAKS